MVAQLVKNTPTVRFDSWVRKIHWRGDRLPTPVLLGFSGGSADKESACNVGDWDSVPGLGRSPGDENSSTHCGVLAWRIPWMYIVHGVTTWTELDMTEGGTLTLG